MFGPGCAYEARGAGARRTISLSAIVHAVARITAEGGLGEDGRGRTAAGWFGLFTYCFYSVRRVSPLLCRVSVSLPRLRTVC
jgi:hypothetical protein